MNKRRTTWLFVALSLLLLPGCYTTQGFIKLEQQQTETIKQAKAGTLLLLEHWEFRSGVIHGALQSQIDALPVAAVNAMKELDDIASRRDKLTDYELGYALGLRISMLEATVKMAVKKFAPDILSYVKF